MVSDRDTNANKTKSEIRKMNDCSKVNDLITSVVGCAQTIGLVDSPPSIFIRSEVASRKTWRDFVFFPSMSKISSTMLDSNFQLRFLDGNI